MRDWFASIFPSVRRRGRWETEAKIRELRAIAEDTNRKLRRALGEPGATPGRHYTYRNSRGHQDMARTLDEALEAVRQASSRTDSIIADRAEIKKRLDEALSGVNLTPEQQAKVDEIFDIETSDAQKIDTALNANVPPPEPTT